MHSVNRLSYRLWRKHGESRMWHKQICPVCGFPKRKGRDREHRDCAPREETDQTAREATR